MPLSAADARTLFREYINEFDTAIPTDARIDLYLLGGVYACQRRFGYYFLDSSVTLAAGTQEYEQPTGLTEAVFLEWNGHPLTKGDVRTWQRDGVNWRNADAGTPKEWALYGDKVILYPSPDAVAFAAAGTATLRHLATPPAIGTNSVAFDKLRDLAEQLPCMYGASMWAKCHPESEQARLRGTELMVQFETEAKIEKEYYDRLRATT